MTLPFRCIKVVVDVSSPTGEMVGRRCENRKFAVEAVGGNLYGFSRENTEKFSSATSFVWPGHYLGVRGVFKVNGSRIAGLSRQRTAG